MSRLRSLWIEVSETLLRMLPFPCATGLVRIGRPGRDAPVLLTGNFRLTVARVRRALAGLDAYLLVANSRGVNVWCAATGGLLTNHDVVSVLKTSGIGELVDHHRVILPQLAATGIEGSVVHKKTGWTVLWGPVRAAEVPAFLARGGETDAAMRRVDFPWPQRLEMAVAWAFPISALGALAVLPWSGAGALALAALVWALSGLLFLAFPLYQSRLGGASRHVGLVFFDFGQRGVLLGIWALLLLALIGVAGLAGALSLALVLRWGIASAVVLAILSLDLMGSTPVYKSGLHEDRLLRIALDEARCRGAGFCEQVCPKEVFRVDSARRLATLPGAAGCVQCGACIVQCPFDALHFEAPDGERVLPDTVRRYKLNLMGRRLVPTARSST